MKKLLFFIGMAAANMVVAQDYNWGFEEWNGAFFNAANAPECSSPANASYGGSQNPLSKWTTDQGVLRTTDARSGNYAAVVCIWYFHTNGTLILDEGCDATNTEVSCKSHFPSKIYGISGYYKYQADSFMPSDIVNRGVTAHIKTYKIDTATGMLDMVSYDSLIFQRTNAYTHFQLGIQYADPDLVPDSVSIWFAARRYDLGEGSCSYSHFLYLDDLEFHFSPMPPLSINQPSLKKKVKIYPNPAKGVLHLDYGSDVQVQNIRLADATGRVVKTFKGYEKVLDVSGMASGVYLLDVQTKEGILREKEVIW